MNRTKFVLLFIATATAGWAAPLFTAPGGAFTAPGCSAGIIGSTAGSSLQVSVAGNCTPTQQSTLISFPQPGATISGGGSGTFDPGIFLVGFAGSSSPTQTGPLNFSLVINGTTTILNGVGAGIYDVGAALAGLTLTNYTISVQGRPVGFVGTLGPGAPPPAPFNYCVWLGSNSQACASANGGSQGAPLLPTAQGNGTFTFSNVASGRWFDPPFVNGFDYAGTGGTLFDSIQLPTGYGSSFIVSANGTSLGTFAANAVVSLGGVSGFRISGINPSVDAALPNAFPLLINFTGGGNGNFSMTGIGIDAVPEPGSLSLLGAGIAVLAVLRPMRTLMAVSKGE